MECSHWLANGQLCPKKSEATKIQFCSQMPHQLLTDRPEYAKHNLLQMHFPNLFSPFFILSFSLHPLLGPVSPPVVKARDGIRKLYSAVLIV